jgi:hypothetical protein
MTQRFYVESVVGDVVELVRLPEGNEESGRTVLRATKGELEQYHSADLYDSVVEITDAKLRDILKY